MIRSVSFLGYILTILVLFGCQAQKSDDLTALFDGNTFKGWEGNREFFRIEENAIVAGRLDREIPRNEFLCTEQVFRNFELRLKFKLIDAETNAGVQIRSRRIPDHHEVSGYQADLGQTFWGCLYDESRRNKILTCPDADLLAPHLKKTDWNDYVIRCEENNIQIWINGYQTVDYTEEDATIEQEGIIGLQIHGGPPGEAWYKDISIRELATY